MKQTANLFLAAYCFRQFQSWSKNLVQKHFLAMLSCIVFTLPQTVFAAWDQSGFPANCRTYAVCDGETCVGTVGNLEGGFVLIQVSEEMFVSSNDIHRSVIRLFASLDDANQNIGRSGLGGANYVMILNQDISDAFGINIYPIATIGGERKIRSVHQKFICSGIGRGRY